MIKKNMNFIKFIKIISINVLTLICLVLLIELGSGVLRIIAGKEFIKPAFFYYKLHDIDGPMHPCNEMKTDILLSHSHNHQNKCKIKNGKIIDDYVIYNFSSDDNPILLTLGGSSTSGFYQHFSEGETYPMQLAKLASKNFFIVNGGVGSYSSLQELKKFLKDGPRFNNLKIVVSLNGNNELKNYHGNDEIRKFNHPFLTDIQYKMNINQNWIEQRVSKVFTHNFISHFLPNTISLYLFIVKKVFDIDGSPFINFSYKKETSGIQSKNFKLNQLLFKPIEAADRWEKNVLRINELVELEGAKYYLFLQPTLGLSGVQSNPKFGSNDEKLFKNLSDDYIYELRNINNELKIRCEKLSFCFDITDKAGPSGNIYSDARHHNKEGNKILAEVIWKVINNNP